MQPCIVKVAPIFIDVYPTLYFVQHLTVRTVRIVKIKFIPAATAPFFAAGVVPLPAAGLGAGFAAALTGALAATGFLGGILKRSVRKLL